MRLLELFTIMELRDRISYAVDTYGKKLAKKLLSDYEQDAHIPRDITNITDSLPVGQEGQVLSVSDMPAYKGSGDERIRPEIAQKIASAVIEYLAKYDPTNNKKYLDWIARQYINGKMSLEDVYKMEDLLSDFDEYKKALRPELEVGLKNPQDINAWGSYRHLASALRLVKGKGKVAGVKVKNFMKKDTVQDMMKHPVPDPVETFGPNGTHDIEDIERAGIERGVEQSTASEPFDTTDWYDWATARTPQEDETSTTEIKPIYVSDRIAVIQPNTLRAGCYLGRGTEWCTGATSAHNAFWEHAVDGPLYVVLTDKHGKFQWHFETNQFMDVHDEPIPAATLHDIVKEYPELREVFREQAMEYGQLWLMDPSEWTPERLQAYMEEGGGWHTAPLDTILEIPKAWDGQASEETLLAAEEIIRERGKDQATWRYLRHPTEVDFLKAIQTKDTGVSGYNPVPSIMNYVKQEGIELSDELLEAAIARDGDAIFKMSIEQITDHPQWVASAIYNQPDVLRVALSLSIVPYESKEDTAIGKAALEALQNPEGMKAVLSTVLHDPTIAADMGGYFGTEPWMQALSLNNISSQDHDGLVSYIKERSPPLDYVQLLTYLIQHEKVQGYEIPVLEKNMPGGKIPVELQHAIIKQDFMHLNFIANPDSSTAALAGQLFDKYEGTEEQVNFRQAEMQAGAARRMKAQKQAST